MNRRIVVTGMGMVSPLANNVADTWKKICNSQSGIDLIKNFDTTNYSVKIAGEVKNFDASNYLHVKDVRHNDAFIHYAIVAAQEAIKDSGLEINDKNSHRIGCGIGSGIGGLHTIEKANEIIANKGPHKLSPFFIPAIIINLAAGKIAIEHNLKGPNIAVATACASGAHTISLAAKMIKYGDADMMVCGGTEMAICPLGVGGFSAMKALSKNNNNPQAACRPWDSARNGFVLGAGSGVLILEEYEVARKRKAKIYAELIGSGMSNDAYHITSPAPEGVGGQRAMEIALNDAKIHTTDIDYINAHATSTVLGDQCEAEAILNLFGNHVEKLAISSTKSMTGHLLGASAAIEAIFSILAIRDNIAPPTINFSQSEKNYPLNFVANQAQERKIDISLSNSFGFGGTNASLIFSRLEN